MTYKYCIICSEVHDINQWNVCNESEDIDPLYLTVGSKMNKSEIKADRMKRSKDHFQKEILPTMSRKERANYTDRYKK